ncbi:MAG TPA: hypothetical protein VIK42_00750 [Bacteroidales bacterium]
MDKKNDISKMSQEEKKAMNKAYEEADRKASRKKHHGIQEEYKPFFSGICDALVKRFGITPSEIKKELSHPATSSTEAFDGKFGSATGSILFHRSLFDLFGFDFKLKKLFEWMAECIRKEFNLRLCIYDPSRPDSEPIKSITLFSRKETTRSREFKKKIEELKEKLKEKSKKQD